MAVDWIILGLGVGALGIRLGWLALRSRHITTREEPR